MMNGLVGFPPTGSPALPAAFQDITLNQDLQLTDTSCTFLKLTNTTSFFSVILPPVEQFPGAGPKFRFWNPSLYPIPIWSYGKQFLLGYVAPNGTAVVERITSDPLPGIWHVVTGDRLMDLGLVFWGASFGNTATNLNGAVACQLQFNYGVMVYYDGTNTVSVGYQTLEGRFILGAKTTLFSGQEATSGSGAGYDLVRVNSTQVALAIYPNAATSLTIQTIDLTTGTLVTTANSTVNVVASVTIGGNDGCALDFISSTLVLLAYGDGTNTKAATVTIAAGVCTVNTATTVQSAVRSGIPRLAVLSPTLAHVLWGTTTTNINSIALSGSTATAGTAAAISSRRNNLALQKISTTQSLAIYETTDTQRALMANVLSASAPIVQSETTLIPGNSNSAAQATTERDIGICNANGTIMLISTANSQNMEWLVNMIRMVNGAPAISPTTGVPAGGVANGNVYTTKTLNNAGLLRLNYSNGTGQTQLKSVCIA